MGRQTAWYRAQVQQLLTAAGSKEGEEIVHGYKSQTLIVAAHSCHGSGRHQPRRADLAHGAQLNAAVSSEMSAGWTTGEA